MLSILLNQLTVLNAMMKREEGQDLIEYALIIVVIVIVAVAGMAGIGAQIATIFQDILVWLQGGGGA